MGLVKSRAIEVVAAVVFPHLLVSSLCVLFWCGTECDLFFKPQYVAFFTVFRRLFSVMFASGHTHHHYGPQTPLLIMVLLIVFVVLAI